MASHEHRISRRLRDALVADLVRRLDTSDLTEILTGPRDEYDWTLDLARQLGMRDRTGVGVHDTLLYVVRELDELVRSWPPNRDARVCNDVAEAATRHLSSVECLTMLLAGPERWMSMKVPGETAVRSLGTVLRPMLKKGLARELERLLERWTEWDVRDVRELRREAEKRAAEATKGAAPASDRLKKYTRPTGRDRIDRITPLFRPPGRT